MICDLRFPFLCDFVMVLGIVRVVSWILVALLVLRIALQHGSGTSRNSVHCPLYGILNMETPCIYDIRVLDLLILVLPKYLWSLWYLVIVGTFLWRTRVVFVVKCTLLKEGDPATMLGIYVRLVVSMLRKILRCFFLILV